MKQQDAYKILELSPGASEEDVQAAFRKMAKKHHPDKKDGDEVKFKEINEAYQTLNNPKSEHHGFDPNDIGNPFGPFGFGINFNMGHQQAREHENIFVDVSFTFNESILGCEKEIKYNRQIMCSDCQGNGFETLSDNCVECGGKGNKVIKQRNMVFMTTCNKCNGSGRKTQKCGKCNDGVIDTEVSVNVKLPGGVSNQQKIRLQGAGNFVAHGFSTDVFLNALVEKDDEMMLEDRDVVSTVNISLLEALTGLSKKVRTVKGEHTLKIPEKIRNGEKLAVSGYGAVGGDHIFKIDVKYPDDVSEIVNVLNK